MRACKDIDFLDNYWKEAKRIAEKVKTDLPKGCGNKRKPYKKGSNLHIVNFYELKNTWSAKDIINNTSNKNTKLEALSDKISNMIHKGRADSVKPMVEAICRDNVKKLNKPISNYEKSVNKKYGDVYKGEFIGYGHFRWNNRPYTLNEVEIEHLKKYFKL